MLLPQRSRVKHFPFTVRQLGRTASTQDVVRRAAAAGAPDGYCVVAAEQTAGRGRQGRSWEAPPGAALLTSVLVRTTTDAARGLPLATGLAVADALAASCALEVQLKWPNDVLAGGRKLAGLLVEVAVPATAGSVPVVVGLGLNRTVASNPSGVDATSLHRLVNEPPSLDVLLAAWLAALDSRVAALERGALRALLDDWRAAATGIGDEVTAVGARSTIEGIAEDIDSDGALLVRDRTGALHRVLAADVHLRR
jgi:BirA family biotin operon repressor/biotin-[acetyl-CoA-carboxylase] ligase